MNKKYLSLLCAIMFTLNLCSCGDVSDKPNEETKQTVEETSSVDEKAESKEQMEIAYQELISATDQLQRIGGAIQGAWHYGIFEDDDNRSLKGLSDSSGISQDDIKATYEGTEMEDYNLNNTVYGSVVFNDFNSCILYVKTAMQLNGMYDNAKKSIDNAKTALQSVTDDLDYYKDMKNYYSSCLAYYEWLESPTGSFEQAKDTINDYNNELKKFKNDMEFDYGS